MIKLTFNMTNLLTLYILIINHKNNLMSLNLDNIMMKMAGMMKLEHLSRMN
jgi:hypothetical protein